MLDDIPGGVEPGMGVAHLRGAAAQVMQQRIDAAGADVGIMVGIPDTVEPCVGIAPLRRAIGAEMQHRVEAGGA